MDTIEVRTEYPKTPPTASCWAFTEARHVLYLDGRDVSRQSTMSYTVRIGAAAYRMAGVAGVGTEPEFRRRGYARRVLDHSLQWMNARGYDISMLFGIPDFYNKAGYVTSVPETGLTITIGHAAAVARKCDVRAYKAADLPEMKKLHRAINKLLASPADRDAAAWGRLMQPVAKNTIVTLAAGKPTGYAIIGGGNWFADMTVRNNDKLLVVPEIVCNDPASADSLLHYLGGRARREGKPEIMCLAPPVGVFSDTCFERGGRRYAYINPNGGGMARIINLKHFCHRLTRELRFRLQASPLAGASICVHLATELGGIIIAADSGLVSADAAPLPARGAVRMPQGVLTRLLFGYDDPEQTLARAGIRMKEPQRQLLCTLFPRRVPYFWPLDRF